MRPMHIFALTVFLALALTLGLVFIYMRPPLGDLVYLLALLSVTGLASAGLGYALHRLGVWRRLPSLNWSITLGYLFAAGLTLLNVWLTARLMFISEHDLLLGTLLMVFAAIISVGFGYFLSVSVTGTLRTLAQGARRVSEGDFAARVGLAGRDEVAELGAAFDQMAERLQEAHERAQALETARRDLVAWASHDLRTPLASLRAMVDALNDGVVSDEETVRRYLRQSQNEIGRMSALIDDLFELAQLDAGRPDLPLEPASLRDLISDTMESFHLLADEKGVLLEAEVGPGLDSVPMAAEQIGRVLANLLDNAVRHTPAGGRVRLSAQGVDGRAEVTVQDNGEGIPPEDLARVFERFYRGEASRSRKGYPRGGSGLGLAIARGMVEAHGGGIAVESRAGEGAEFRFWLPL